MFKRVVLISAAFAVSTLAQKSDEDVKAEEIVHEKPTEWKVFSASAQVVSFAVHKDILWFATADMLFSSNLKKADAQKFPALGKMSGTGITSIAADPTGNMWFAGPNGVAMKSGAGFTNYTTENGLPDNDVKDLAVSPDGKVWVATVKGAAAFSAGSWKVYTTANGLISDDVRVIEPDTKGNIWFGTNKGISVFSGSSWTLWDMKKGMSWNEVKAMSWDKRKNTMWAAVGEKDVNTFENSTCDVYMDVQLDITSIMIDTQSRVWFGSTNGIVKFNGEEWQNDPKQHGIPSKSVIEMYRDDGGNLWFGMESGVLRLTNPYPY